MSPYGWQVSLLHSPAVVQITVSTVRLHLSFIEVDCFCAVWNETALQLFTVFYVSQNCLYFTKNKLSYFLCFLSLFCTFITGIS